MNTRHYRTSSLAALLFFAIVVPFTGCAGSAVHSQNNAKAKVSENPANKTGKKMSAELNYKTVDKLTAFKQLDSYIFDLHYGRKSEPKSLDPAHVEEFIREKIDRTKAPQSFERTRNVVDIYDLASVRDHFEKMLTRNEKDEREILQSIQSVRLIAEQGDANTEKKAFDYYEYLVKHPASQEQYEALVDAASSFSKVYSPATLQEVLKREYPKLKEKGKTDYYIDGVAEQIFTLLNGRLPSLVDQISARNRILDIAKAEDRITKLVSIYLSQDDLTSPETERWAARQLRKADREGQTDVIISVLRKASTAIKAAGFQEEDRDAYLLRSARAVRYFRAELSPEEKELVEAGSEYQIDYLDRDLF